MIGHNRLLHYLVSLCCCFATLTGFRAGSVQAQSDDPSPPDQPVRLIFIHHSTGENWLEDGYGELGLTLDSNNYFVSDTNYGWGPGDIGDRTDIVNWPEWFGPERSERALNRLYAEDGQNSSYTRRLRNPGGENEIIMFKSCFPNSELSGSPNDPPSPGDYDYTVGSAKYIYNQLLDYFLSRPDKMFVVITAPPVSSSEYAANARAFNNWLVYDWLSGYPGSNVFVFDFYNVLTGPDNHHRFEGGQVEHVYTPEMNTLYYPSGDDHPSEIGSRKAATEFMPLLNVYYNRWRASTPYQPPEGSQPQPEAPAQQSAGTGMFSAGALLEDFEAGFDGWGSYDDGVGSSMTCGPDSSRTYNGGYSLRIEYSLVPEGWVGCERYYDSPQDWSASEGISFAMLSQRDGSSASFIVVVEQDDQHTPFEAFYEIHIPSTGEWLPVMFTWQDFERPSWAEEGGPQTFDPASVVGFNFAFNAGSEGIENVLWVDDITLGSVASLPEPAGEPEEEAEAYEEEESAEEERGGVSGVIGRLCPLSLALPLIVLLLAKRRLR